MKKILTMLFVLGLINPVIAADQRIVANGKPVVQSSHKGGFQGPSRAKRMIKDVISALNSSDDSQVQLTGYLIMSLGDENYIFKDQTGEITVEIDDDLWRGRIVTPRDQIQLFGEVEKDWDNLSIEVDHFEINRT